MKSIVIKGAREHNLKNINVELPRDRFIVITGVSGSGKSTLAFDTIYAEGQRRYVESLSAYARQFLGQMNKPDVDSIEGLSPAISIEQKTTSNNPRSTVGTVTEIYDYLRLLFARIGTPHCPEHGIRIQAQSPERIADSIIKEAQSRTLPGEVRGADSNTQQGGDGEDGEANADSARFSATAPAQAMVSDTVALTVPVTVTILAPVVRAKKGTYGQLFSDLNSEGFSRVRVNGAIRRTDETIELDRYKKHDIEIVMDRLDPLQDRSRLVEAIENALKRAEGLVIALFSKPSREASESGSDSGTGAESWAGDGSDEEGEARARSHVRARGRGRVPSGGQGQGRERTRGLDAGELQPQELLFSSVMACPVCGLAFEELSPRTFSFNNPLGACESCKGLGIRMEFDPDLIIPDRDLSIADGAVALYRNAIDGWRGQHLAAVAKHFGFDVFTPIKKLTPEQYSALMFGSDEKISFSMSMKNGEAYWMHNGQWEGLVPQSIRLYGQTASEYRREELERFMRVLPCPDCEGKRLKEKVLAVEVAGSSIVDVTDLSIDESLSFFESLPPKLTETEKEISGQVLKEITSRIGFLNHVGLGYLTLSRSAGSLSGGEAQRIRLATQIGSNLTGVLYVLDEPSIGLHQRDNARLIETLKRLRDIGNTLVVVEHDEETIRSADHVLDIGPGAGIHGGYVVAEGTPEEIEANTASLTGQYLSGKKSIETPKSRRRADKFIRISGCSENNLKGIDAAIPIGILTVVTGVSGSGKSTLIYDTLYRALMQIIYDSSTEPGRFKEISFDSEIDKVIVIDQSPIGRTPRSNPATYTKIFDPIRQAFAETKEAKLRGYKAGRFSFNVRGGRCEACQGEGLIKIEMNFLSDVYIQCEECKGARYNRETLEVKYRGRSIAEVLDMTVEEAREHFKNQPVIRGKLDTLFGVGLGYIKLGQSSTTLSGGEAQRIKLTRELAKRGTGRTIYLLDEPTTGLHFDDVKKLISVLDDLVSRGNTVVVIEHNLDVIRCADHIIDMGPEGGQAGGRIVATGTPEEIASVEESHTGRFLRTRLSA